MSGTSLDGISAAVVQFRDEDTDGPSNGNGNGNGRAHGSGTAKTEAGHVPVRHQLLGFTRTDFSRAQREVLVRAMRGGTAEEYCRLGFRVGGWLATAAEWALERAGIPVDQVRAIASHGQTLWHVPALATWQLGESAVVAERLGVDVVSDFRVRDVAAGGEGAPLVPIADAMLYAHPRRARLLQNIGGIGNVSSVPPAGELRRVRAFDTGPGMAVIDAVVRTLFPDRSFDLAGQIAATGTVNQNVLAELLRDPYFAGRPPKSTGRERFGNDYAERLVQMCAAEDCTPADMVATAVALTARSIANAYRAFIPRRSAEVVLSGGGVRNLTLVRALEHELTAGSPSHRYTVAMFEDLFYDPEAKEAVAFALLAHLHLNRRPGNVTGATGALGRRVLGKLTPA